MKINENNMNEFIQSQKVLLAESQRAKGALGQELGKKADENSTLAAEKEKLQTELAVLTDTSQKICYLGSFKITFYCGEDYPHICGSRNGETSSGVKAQPNHTIAVDPSVIPIGSSVYIEGMGEYVAEDTGGAIQGNKIDVFVQTHAEALELGTFTENVWLYLE